MTLNFSTFNFTDPAPVTVYNLELVIVLLLFIAFCQGVQLVVVLYFLSFKKEDGE
ncbi:hypothetical protein HWN40_13225 [Methanolobus zinderi]|uniref:Uncharacterized protein n=1 Tax=Methanolobus zinderi TaxID=536044 RepID=A0A7D5E9R3_9EURY|nr:hypothetical protein [Methanolobus zinderi]QLC51111.1 hypothetical protein HWN40_13225 [Methanolobus zinderi]